MAVYQTESTPYSAPDQDQEQDQEQEQETVAPASLLRPPDGEPEGKADEATEPGESAPPEDHEPAPPLFRLEPVATNGAQLSRPDEGLQLLAEASNARFVTTSGIRGPVSSEPPVHALAYIQQCISAFAVCDPSGSFPLRGHRKPNTR